jgi:hypothetical protein
MKRVRYKDWTPFGWQGFLLRVPTEWNPGRISGDFKSGSVRLDDAEVVRMELEWREAGGDVSISGIVDRFVEGLAKDAQRKKGRLEIKRRFDLPGAGDRPSGSEQETVFWETDCRVYALVRRCAASNRIAFVRIIGRRDEDLAEVARDVLLTLEDQAPEGPRRWALYDLLCDIPPGFDLETCTLRSGHIQLRFTHGQSTLRVDRLSMAGILLKERPVQAWFEDFFNKELRDLDCTFKPYLDQRHRGIHASGNPRSRWRTILSPLPLLNVRKRLALDGCAWHCPESNKIYAVLTLYQKKEDTIPVEEVCRGVVCHKTESADQSRGDARIQARAE